MSPDSIATSVPVPIAMPTSACASAGASLMPSPTIATTAPSACSFCTSSALPPGSTSASTRSMPSCRPIASPVRRLSPVIITTLLPMRRSASTASRACSLTRVGDGDEPGDAARRRRRAPAVLPVRLERREPRLGVAEVEAAAPPCSARLPTTTSRPSTIARTPLPVTDLKCAAAGTARPRAAAPRHHRLGERVLGELLDRGGQAQQLVAPRRAERDDVGQLGRAAGQRAGLVEDDRRHAPARAAAPRRS